MAKAGFVTIIGRPNVGKSTLMNTLIGQKIAITSYKPQTTRSQIRTIYTDERGQIVFLDTPGIHRENDRLGEYMLKASESTLSESDVVLWLVEARKLRRDSAHHVQQEEGQEQLPPEEVAIIHRLSAVKRPVIIVLTKIDRLPKEALLPLIQLYSATWTKEKQQALSSSTDSDQLAGSTSSVEIIPVSARTHEGCDDLMNTIYRLLPEGEPFYDADEVTTQTQRQIAAEIIREKALRLLQEEVPHGIAVQINKMHTRKGSGGKVVCDIEADIICEREAHKGIIIGAGGSMLKKIGTQAREDIENMLETKVNLQLFVKVRRDWKDDEKTLRMLGYNKKDLQ